MMKVKLNCYLCYRKVKTDADHLNFLLFRYRLCVI